LLWRLHAVWIGLAWRLHAFWKWLAVVHNTRCVNGILPLPGSVIVRGCNDLTSISPYSTNINSLSSGTYAGTWGMLRSA